MPQIFYRISADAVVLLHLAFVLFVALGGLLVVRRRKWAWLHIPVALWGAAVELAGWVCPLTPLENWLREMGGGEGYTGDFVARWVLPCLYPEGLTRSSQVALGLFVILANAALYSWAILRAARER